MAEGIDVFTAYQNVTDWSKVRAAGKTFAFVKVSDGMSAKPTNGWGPAARAAGVAVGGYHYAQPGDPVAQADLLIAQAAASGCTDLGRALDVEAPFVPGQTAANFAISFLSRIRDRGFLPVLYGNDSMLSYVAPQVRAAVPQTWIWVARYGANPKTPWNTWQYSSSGSVPGIQASAVDLNTGAIPYNTTSSEDDLPSVDDILNASVGKRADGTSVSVRDSLANTYLADFQGGGDGGAYAIKPGVNALVAKVDALSGKVATLSASQPAPVDLDALAAKIAPVVAASIGGAVATAVAAELAKRLES